MMQFLPKNTLLFISLFFLAVGSGPALARQSGGLPTKGDFRSIASGLWSSSANWERFDGTTWRPAALSPDSGAGTIRIREGHSISISSPLAYDQVVVEHGGEVIVLPGVNHTLTDGQGTDLTIEGTWKNQGATWTIAGSARWNVNDGGFFIQQTTSGIATPISKGALAQGSTFIYRGGSSLVPSSTFSGKTYGNLRFESSAGAFSLSASGSGSLLVNGDLTIGEGVKWNTGGLSGSITVQGTTTIDGEWSGSGGGALGVHTFESSFVVSASGKYSLATTGASQGSLVFKGDVQSSPIFLVPSNRLVEFSGSGVITITAPARMQLAGGAIAHCGIAIPAGSTLEIGVRKRLILHGDLEVSGCIVRSDSESTLLVSDSSRSMTNNGSIAVPTTFDSTVVDRTISGNGTWATISVERGTTLHISGSHSLLGRSIPLDITGAAVFQDGSVIIYHGLLHQTISPQRYRDLVVDNNEGASLSGATVVDGTLTLRTRPLTTGSFSLELGSAASIEEIGLAKVMGSVTSTRRLSTASIESFGGIGISLQPDLNSGQDVTVTRRTDTSLTFDHGKTIRRYFTVAPSTCLESVRVSFRIDPTELNGASESRLQLFGSQDGRSGWTRIGGQVDTTAHVLMFSGNCSYPVLTLAEPFAAPKLNGVCPAAVEQGCTVGLIVSGSGFASGSPQIVFSGTGVKTNGVVVQNDSTLTINITIDSGALPGFRDLHVETQEGEAQLLSAFEIVKMRNPVPRLKSIAPATGSRLESLAVTLHGSGFVEGLTRVSFGDNITVSSYVLEPTLIVTSICIDAGASPGMRDVTVSNQGPGGGCSALNQSFSVTNPIPMLDQAPSVKIARGECRELSIFGSGFISGVTTLSSAKGAVVESLFVVSPNLLKARIRIEFAVAGGPLPLSVSNQGPGGGVSILPEALMINDPPPSVTQITPTRLVRGRGSRLEIRGAGFVEHGLSLSLGQGILIDSMNTLDSCTIRAYLSVSRGAAAGIRDLIVANRGTDGESSILHGALVVENPSPVISRVEPPTVTLGQTSKITLSGADFFPDTTTLDFGPEILAGSCVCDSSGRSLTSTLTVSSNAAVGARMVRVANLAPGGGEASPPGSFAVVNPVPSLLSFTPVRGGRGQSMILSITGTNFIRGTTLLSLNSGISVDSVSVISSVLLTARILIQPDAIVGARTIAVTNPTPGGGAASLMYVFNVENSTPLVTSVYPEHGARGEVIEVTLGGAWFEPGNSTVSFGDLIVVNSVRVIDAQKIVVRISVSPGTSIGARTITVSNPEPGGGTASLVSGFVVTDASTTSVPPGSIRIPREYSLGDAYPNPLNPTARIRFGLPEQSVVRLAVFDMLGRVVGEIANRTFPAGYHEVLWNASGMAGGVYFVQLIAESLDSSRGMRTARRVLVLK